MTFADWLARRDDRLRRRGPGRRGVAAEILRLEPRTLMAVAVLGDEARINAVAAGDQSFAPAGGRSIAVDPGGDVIAAWTTPARVGRGTDIVVRRVDPDGAPLGDEIVVNATPGGMNRNPVVAASNGGTFVVAWEAQGNPGDRSGWGVFARVYSSGGTALTG